MNIIIPLTIASLFLVSCEPAKTKTTAAEQSAKPYPLDTCLVSGEKLGSMGAPVEVLYEGQRIKFCCKSCIKKFEANKSEYLAKLK
ncbi:MAG: hypothetical protein V4689_15290 [Verrucomicrobiota bacterium]